VRLIFLNAVSTLRCAVLASAAFVFTTCDTPLLLYK
jgi:hypothetical protein